MHYLHVDSRFGPHFRQQYRDLVNCETRSDYQPNFVDRKIARGTTHPSLWTGAGKMRFRFACLWNLLQELKICSPFFGCTPVAVFRNNEKPGKAAFLPSASTFGGGKIFVSGQGMKTKRVRVSRIVVAIVAR
jgi:hypothetical protein